MVQSSRWLPHEVGCTVVLPVHGIETQRVRGDHAGLARRYADVEGPSTVCLYAADAADPVILSAYRSAGHRCVVLGNRMEAAFLGILLRPLPEPKPAGTWASPGQKPRSSNLRETVDGSIVISLSLNSPVRDQ